MRKYLYAIQLVGTDICRLGITTSSGIKGEIAEFEKTNSKKSVLLATKRVSNPNDLFARIDSKHKAVNGLYTLTADNIDAIVELPKEMDDWAKHHDVDSILSLYSLTKYMEHLIGRKLNHSLLMRKVERWTKLEAFGACHQIVEACVNTNQHGIRTGSGGHTSDVTTYELTPRQAVAIAGSISMVVQLAVIDRLHYMESTYDPEMVTQNIIALEYMDDYNNLTLYGICKFLKNKLNHNINHSQLMNRKMSTWLGINAFGKAEKCGIMIPISNGAERRIATYMLTPRQAIAVAGSISMAVQLNIVDRLTVLERKFEPDNVTVDRLAEAIRVYRAYVDDKILPAGVNGPGVYIERISKGKHTFCYKPGQYIVNPMSDDAKLSNTV